MIFFHLRLKLMYRWMKALWQLTDRIDVIDYVNACGPPFSAPNRLLLFYIYDGRNGPGWYAQETGAEPYVCGKHQLPNPTSLVDDHSPSDQLSIFINGKRATVEELADFSGLDPIHPTSVTSVTDDIDDQLDTVLQDPRLVTPPLPGTLSPNALLPATREIEDYRSAEADDACKTEIHNVRVVPWNPTFKPKPKKKAAKKKPAKKKKK